MAADELRLEYAQAALDYNENDANANKWFAILTGEKGSRLGAKQKIQHGYIFKEYLDKALDLNPSDPSLHHLKGIFCFELGKLSSFERFMASTLLEALPAATIQDAIEDFTRADSLSQKPWKMNCVYLAKCYNQESRPDEAKRWLNRALEIQTRSHEDRQADEEISELRRALGL